MLFYKGQVLSEEIWGAWRHPVYPNTTYSKLLKFLSISGQDVIQEFAVEVVKHELGISNNRAEVFGSLCMPKVSPIRRLNALKITKNKLLNLYLLSDTLLDI